jgi:hypothetical protein
MMMRRRLCQAPVTPLEAPQPPKMAGATPRVHVLFGGAAPGVHPAKARLARQPETNHQAENAGASHLKGASDSTLANRAT